MPLQPVLDREPSCVHGRAAAARIKEPAVQDQFVRVDTICLLKSPRPPDLHRPHGPVTTRALRAGWQSGLARC